MALGAPSGQILRSVMLQSVGLALIGISLGLLGTIAVTRVFRSVLADAEPNEPLVLVVASTVLIAAATIAGYLPARRAARLRPTEVLRT